MTTQDPYGQQLMDEFACRRVMEQYWYAENRRDVDGVAKTFTADGRWGATVGRDAIRAEAAALYERLRSLEQHPISIGSINIDLDGDRATGYIQAVAHTVHREPDGTRRISVVDAIYHLAFTREPDAWRISSMTGGEDAPLRRHGGSFRFDVPMAPDDSGGTTGN